NLPSGKALPGAHFRRHSALAVSAEHAAALTQAAFGQCRATQLAQLPGAAVYEQLLLEIPGFAITADEVTQGGAATVYGPRQYLSDLLGQRQIARPADPSCLAPGIDTGGEQRLGCIDVADPDDHGVVHDEGFDRHAALARQLVEALTGELIGQRLRPETA